MDTTELAHVEDLQYFVGKVCTVITPNINWKFDERQLADYFTGIIEKVSSSGIWMIHPITRNKNFYFASQVTAIIEEQFITPDDPSYDKVVEQYKDNKKPKQPVVQKPVVKPPESPFMDIDELEKLAKAHRNEKRH